MRILVTGATGHVGGAIAPRLKHMGTILTPPEQEFNLSHLQSIPGMLDRMAPDLIINPAAYTAVDNAEDEPDLAMAVNGRAPGIIARWAASRDVPLIHFSTDYVFNGAGERPWCEDDVPQPLSVYGETKLAGDTEVAAAGGSSLIVRTSWIYADRGKNFVRTITKLAQGRSELRVVSDQIGAPTSAAIIADFVTGLVSMDRHSSRIRFVEAHGLVNLTSVGETSWYHFALAVIQGLKSRGAHLQVESVVPVSTAEYPTKARRPQNSRLNLGRLRRVFGFAPLSWQAALAPELDKLVRELI